MYSTTWPDPFAFHFFLSIKTNALSTAELREVQLTSGHKSCIMWQGCCRSHSRTTSLQVLPFFHPQEVSIRGSHKNKEIKTTLQLKDRGKKKKKKKKKDKSRRSNFVLWCQQHRAPAVGTPTRTEVSSSLSSCKWQLLCQPLLGRDGLFYESREGTVGQGIKIWATNWKQQGVEGDSA